MGIINATPDSFYAGSRTGTADAVKARVEAMVAAGVDMLDVGAYSSRPGAADVTPQEEIDRLGEAMSALRSVTRDIPVSVDTFRADVARTAVTSMGADIVNDIAAGDLDSAMFDTVAELQVPYIAMHTRGTPATMQSLTDYPEHGVAATVAAELSPKLRSLALKGVADVIVDPGFGFAKTVEQNYELMDDLGDLTVMLERPLLVGISRKSMMTRLFGITAAEALPATAALNMAALLQGASIIRVHDVAEGVQVRDMAERLSREPLTRITEIRKSINNII